MNNIGIFYLIWLKFWFKQKFAKEIVFESSVLAWIRSRIRIRIRIELKCWIRFRIESIRNHNPGFLKIHIRQKGFESEFGSEMLHEKEN
jgi:hypothetical protein